MINEVLAVREQRTPGRGFNSKSRTVFDGVYSGVCRKIHIHESAFNQYAIYTTPFPPPQFVFSAGNIP